MIGEKMEGTMAHVVDETLTPPAKESGSQLAALVKLICTPLSMLEIYHDAWMKDFERRVAEKFKKIPEDQTQAPPLNIVGPALEASKYHLGVEEMREMFANLVSHACDKKWQPPYTRPLCLYLHNFQHWKHISWLNLGPKKK